MPLKESTLAPVHTPSFDIAVVGAGILGLAHAWMAHRRGLRVAVVDRDPRCLGASIRNFGFVTVTGQGPDRTWTRARRSAELWQEAADAAEIPVLHRGLWLLAQRPESLPVLEAFMETPMAEGCELLRAESADYLAQLGRRAPCLQAQGSVAALYSPHELRVESKEAIPALAAWLEREGVAFYWDTEALAVEEGCLTTSRGSLHAARIALCPGTHLRGLAAPYLEAALGGGRLGLTQLQMMRVMPREPFALPAAVMTDHSLVRYTGYSHLGLHDALEQRILAEEPGVLEDGIHLIVVQSADGSLVVGDTHHPAAERGPFGLSSSDDRVLRILEQTLRIGPYDVVERWVGQYPTGAGQDALLLAPAPWLRVGLITSGTGASTSFGIAEEVFQTWFN